MLKKRYKIWREKEKVLPLQQIFKLICFTQKITKL